MVKISCIIPAYNVEAYIERCLSSILNQRHANVEVIVVDDGSTDSTPDLLRKIAAADSRVAVFHQENARQGAARNLGLEHATGDYIWFIDADDWLEEGALLHIQRLVEAHSPDVIFTNISYFSDEKGYSAHLVPGDFAGETLCPDELDEKAFAILFSWQIPPYCLIASRHMIEANAIRFPAGLFYEDHPFGLRVLRAANHVYVDPLPVYTYYQRVGSTVYRQDDKIFDFIAIRKQCLELLCEFGWDKKFPSLFLSYLLPVSFYEVHVPDIFRKKFLQSLREDCGYFVPHFLQELPHIHGRSKHLLKAIQAGSPLIYELKELWHSHLAPKAWIRQCAALLRHCHTRKKKFKKSGTWHNRMPLSESPLCCCHPSADMTQCHLDVRVTWKNAPYVYADEGAVIGGQLVFERGVGTMRFGRRSSVGGGSLIICSQEGGIEIGEQVLISWGCTIMDSNAHSLDAAERLNDEWYWQRSAQAGCLGLFKDWTGVRGGPVKIDTGAWVGCNSIILGNVHIGQGAIIGAGSVVTRSVPPFTVFAGNPARFIKLAPRREGWSGEDLHRAQEMKAPQSVLDAIQLEIGRCAADTDSMPPLPAHAEMVKEEH